jgi:membrane associated rhomboid family serine protease
MFNQLPPVVKNLIIINVLMILATQVFPDSFMKLFAGYYFLSPNFAPWQIVTHMFMHGGLMHILVNMFGLFMFGTTLEKVWGSKRFLTYYMITGLGAFFLHFLVIHLQVRELLEIMNPEIAEVVIREGATLLPYENYRDPDMGKLNILINSGVVGASGAVFGILLAFGMLFPNTELMLLFPPIPIKAKVFVFIYGAIELYMGLQNNEGDNVAHFAHLGGMLFGYIVLKVWQRKRNHFF